MPERPTVSRQLSLVDRRTIWICCLSVALGLASSYAALWLVRLINFFTNLSFYGRFSMSAASPADNHLGLFVIVIPVLGGLIVGFMARYGSTAIRGHGIPEAMEEVLVHQSRIPPRVLLLKPLSAAISIGTGGPFGAEGPIIATGGALGSLFGQLVETTAAERKTLLAAGGAAGMTAIFGSPVSSVLLAVELLLFELRPRSVIPVALASAASMGLRLICFGAQPAFPMPDLAPADPKALIFYVLIGGTVGLLSIAVTRLVYRIEDAFALLPIHWMWWPAVGGAVVGVIGIVQPHTMGVGYDNITAILGGNVAAKALLAIAALKFLSWAIALGSGTSGGTLAPLFTIGGACGGLAGLGLAHLLPEAGLDPRVAALVGMAAIFSGATRALLTSVIFAFEATRQPWGLLPILAGATTAYLLSCWLMRRTIMTEKIERHGVHVPDEYAPDYLESTLVRDVAPKNVETLKSSSTVEEVRRWMAQAGPGTEHQGWPVVDEAGRLAGVLTRRDLYDPGCPLEAPLLKLFKRPLAVIYEDCTLHQAQQHMVHEGVGRLPVVSRQDRRKLLAVITRSDILFGAMAWMRSEHKHGGRKEPA